MTSCVIARVVTTLSGHNHTNPRTEAITSDLEWVIDALDVIDIVLNGEVPLGGFELPGGPIGAVAGLSASR